MLVLDENWTRQETGEPQHSDRGGQEAMEGWSDGRSEEGGKGGREEEKERVKEGRSEEGGGGREGKSEGGTE